MTGRAAAGEPSTHAVEALVIGSGAGGAITALELAKAGMNVVVLEEGDRVGLDRYGANATVAMPLMYRHRGMTPIMGRAPIGYVEGCVVGGSTEINSGFWHRTPHETILRWCSQFGLQDASIDSLAAHFTEIEHSLGVGTSVGPWPASTRLFAEGAEAMGWSAQEVPRAAIDCGHTNACAYGCPKGAKQGVSRNLLPAAEKAGARLFPRCRAKLLLRKRGRVVAVLAELRHPEGGESLVRIEADHVFVCAGATETPTLLRRSGMRLHVGDSFRIHPMLKVIACFPDPVDAVSSVLPLIQVKEFAPEVTIGGGFFTLGHMAMALSDNWLQLRGHVDQYRNMATYYVAVRGTGRGSVRTSFFDERPQLHYDLSEEDVINMSKGFARLCMLLLAAGAVEIYPGVVGLSPISSELAAVRWLDEPLPWKDLSLTTVHAFSSCPIGERRDRVVADSFGRLFDHENLYINDASMLPDSPGVNPQGSVMAFARRNVLHFLDSNARRS